MTSFVNANLIARLLQAAESEQIKRHYDYAALLSDAANAIVEVRFAALDEAAEVAKAHNGASKRERQAKKHYLYAEDLAEIRAEERGEDIASSIIHANILALKETPDAK